jgi:hypothetical protein
MNANNPQLKKLGTQADLIKANFPDKAQVAQQRAIMLNDERQRSKRPRVSNSTSVV